MPTIYVRRDQERVSPPLGSERSAHKWLQRHQGQSNDHALKYEGYDIETVEDTGEHSDRAAFVTHQVLVWIENDSDRIEAARAAARRGDLDRYLKAEITRAAKWDAAWHVRQELGWNDMEYRVHYEEIAASLLSE